MRLRIASVVAAIAIGVSCAKSPVAPDGPYAGTWRGTITDAVYGVGRLEMTLTPDDPTRYRGSWRMTFAAKEIVGAVEFLPEVLADSIYFLCQRTSPPASTFEDGSPGISLLDISCEVHQATGKLRLTNRTGCEGTGGGPVSLTRQ